MQAPTTLVVREGDGVYVVPEEGAPTPAEAAAILGMKGSTTDHAEIVCWNGHGFEIVASAIATKPSFYEGMAAFPWWGKNRAAREDRMVAHFPVDPRMTRADVHGAVKAEHNADGTAWMFYPASDKDAMVDREDALGAAVVRRFAQSIDAAQIKVNEATNAAVKAASVRKHATLVAFRDAVVEVAVDVARTHHIGWMEQNPHEAHVHALVRQAVETVTATWQTDRTADYGRVSAPVAAVLKGLTKLHAYEWAWDQRARLAAEAKAKADAEAAAEGESDTPQGD